ncbi:MAG: hypothetical protein JOZ62_11580 [Acidobacteriaceae bacterium]|nr:hypothetical protein [Acidobacteriaceae bacterium]
MRKLSRAVGGAVVAMLTLLALAYVLDYLSLRFRIPNRRPQFGTVHVQPYLAVPQKNGRTEFILDTPSDQRCVYSLFPHFGETPCWYLEKHKSKRINM